MHLLMTDPQLFVYDGSYSSGRAGAVPPCIWKLPVPRWRQQGAGNQCQCLVMEGTPRIVSAVAKRLQSCEQND